MPKASQKRAEPKAEAPSFLEIGTQAPMRHARVKVGEQHLQKLFGWWEATEDARKQIGGETVGVPAFKLAEELGLQRPRNGNSFRANLQRQFDQLSIDGETMFLSLRGAGENRFEVLPTTMVYFHPVSANERHPTPKVE
jgi:hypothetical protein